MQAELPQAGAPITILSYGMGVESTAVLLRWILEPDTRPCALSDLIVVTAQVGEEYLDTARDVETHVLPLMREHGIRYVQLARHGHLEADGITVLSDTRQPTRVQIEGDYRLSDELRRVGVLPQAAGVHKCALKFKAFVIEKWLSSLSLEGTTNNEDGSPRTILHAIGYNASETSRIESSEYAFKARVAFGFNADESARIDRANEYDGLREHDGHRVAFGYSADETSRITKNSEYNTLTRQAFYPLLEWGWTRAMCLDYLRKHLGITWRKSACVFCPFAHNRQNAAELAVRHQEHPDEVAAAMALEHVSLAMNPRGTLYKSHSLIQITRDAGNAAAVATYEKRLAADNWAIYRVRRIYNADKKTRAKKRKRR